MNRFKCVNIWCTESSYSGKLRLLCRQFKILWSLSDRQRPQNFELSICRQSNRNLPEYNRRAFGKKWSKNTWLICRASGWFIASSKESPNRFICSHVYHSCCFNRIENIKSEFIRRQGSVYKYIFTHCTWAIAIFNIPNWNWKWEG
jgi:hypothetical protein